VKVITLQNIDDITNVEVGQTHVFSADIGTSALDGSPTVLTVTAVDRALGTITYAAGADVTNAHYIFNQGDRDNNAPPTLLKFPGLLGWLPDAAPSSTAFFGQDRSVDTTRLGGVRVDATSLPIEEAMIEGLTQGAREGFKMTHLFLNYRSYGNLAKALGTKVRYIDAKIGKVGFSGFTVEGPRGPVDVYADQNCPAQHMFALTLRLWKLASVNSLVGLTDEDGMSMLRMGSADGVEVRYGSYAAMATGAPGAHANIKIAA
jgi:hypothetical protein